MRFSTWPDGSYPVYLNPTFEELIELAKSRVDTLRICEYKDQLAVASGYGNTHTSVTAIARKEWGKRWHPYTHILFQRMGAWAWNLNSADVFVSLEEGYRHVEIVTVQAVRDFVNLVEQEIGPLRA